MKSYHFNKDPDPDTDPTFHFVADLDQDPSFQIKGQNLEKGLKWSHIPYILACHLQNSKSFSNCQLDEF